MIKKHVTGEKSKIQSQLVYLEVFLTAGHLEDVGISTPRIPISHENLSLFYHHFETYLMHE